MSQLISDRMIGEAVNIGNIAPGCMFLIETKSDSPSMLQIALLLILAVAGRQLLYICLGYADYLLERARKKRQLREAFRRRRD